MRKNINQLGGDINADNIRCRRCYAWQGGGFDPNFGVLICANRMKSKSHAEDTIAHGRCITMLEMVLNGN